MEEMTPAHTRPRDVAIEIGGKVWHLRKPGIALTTQIRDEWLGFIARRSAEQLEATAKGASVGELAAISLRMTSVPGDVLARWLRWWLDEAAPGHGMSEADLLTNPDCDWEPMDVSAALWDLLRMEHFLVPQVRLAESVRRADMALRERHGREYSTASRSGMDGLSTTSPDSRKSNSTS